jgi:predicted lipase
VAVWKVTVVNNSLFDLRGIVGYAPSDNAIVIAFRGTVDPQNEILDIDLPLVPYPNCTLCTVHQGFYSGYQLLEPYVHDSVKMLKSSYGSAKIFVTGFSLGGALAGMAAMDIANTFNKVDQLYTFGQPRIGNQVFAANFIDTIK